MADGRWKKEDDPRPVPLPETMSDFVGAGPSACPSCFSQEYTGLPILSECSDRRGFIGTSPKY